MTGAGPPLGRSTLDRAAHRRTDASWLADAWLRARVLVVDVTAGGRALVRDGERPALVLLSAAQTPVVPEAARLFLGVEPDGTAVFAVDASLPTVADARSASLREVGHLLTDRDVGLLVTAVALANWHAGHGFSPATGRATRMDEGGWSRVDDSGHRVWPRTDPAMIVLVHDDVAGPDGRCLLGSNAAWPSQPGRRRFSCLAGYVEPGESAEAAVIREVAEEVGVPVDRVEYVSSQSWPFPGSLMLGFRALADPTHPVCVDPGEISHARWFTRREIGGVLAGETVWADEATELVLPPPLSIAFHLIRHWMAD